MASVLVVLVLSMLSTCSWGRRERPNLLLIVIDTLRADRLGSYGNQRGLTPFLDSLAARGTVFRRAYAQSSWTNPSVASLFTSRFPSEHGVTAPPRNRPAPADGEVTIAELLRDHGYATGAFVANAGMPGLSDDPRRADEPIENAGFGQGFEAYRLNIGHRVKDSKLWQNAHAADVNRQALYWLGNELAQEKRPVFLYVHYMEPHIPYLPPAEILQRLTAGRARLDLERVNAYATMWRRRPAGAKMRAALGDAYDAEVASVDQGIAELLSELTATGFLDNAVVVVTSDHGEEFFEHEILGHGNTLYDLAIHVPLLMAATADRTGHGEVSDVVSLIDVAPTLLDLAGIAQPNFFRGTSLAPHLGESSGLRRWIPSLFERAQPTPAFSELIQSDGWERLTPHRYAVIAGTRKLISGIDGRLTAYDLAADPLEMHPEPGRDGKTLQNALIRFLAEVADPTPKQAPTVAEPDPETLERLRALGYAE